MFPMWKRQQCTPIGCDISDGSVKLVQFSADQSRLIDAARWDLNLVADETDDPFGSLSEGIERAREGRAFRGKETVVCLRSEELFLQNVRVAKSEGPELERLIKQEAASRIPFPIEETEIRFVEAADIRQGESVLREVIVMACHRPVVHSLVAALSAGGLRPIAIEVAPSALLRSYLAQFRRDDERTRRALIVHVGYQNSLVVIAQGDDVLFIKYLDFGGRHLTEAVAQHLSLDAADSHALCRKLGSSDLDADVERSLRDALRPELERLTRELSMCVRYHSVTFRGRALEHLLLTGSEANEYLLQRLQKQLDLECELSNPFRRYPSTASEPSRLGQWDVAAGLALRSQPT